MPLSTPSLIPVPATPWLAIELHFPIAEAASHLDPAIQEVLTALAHHGLSPAGPLVCRHLARPTTHFHLHCGFPVPSGASFPPSGRLVLAALPETQVFRAVYRGGYDGLAGAWGEFMGSLPGLLSAHPMLAPSGPFRESYLTDPSSVPDPAQWETLLDIEVKLR